MAYPEHAQHHSRPARAPAVEHSFDEPALSHINNARQALLTVRELADGGAEFNAGDIRSLVDHVLSRLAAAVGNLRRSDPALVPPRWPDAEPAIPLGE